MHARTDEEIYVVKVRSDIRSSKYWRLKAALNGMRKASKHWQEYSSDKLVTDTHFQQNDINPCVYKRFHDNLDLEQHGDDFLVVGLTSRLECLAEESKRHPLAKKAELVSWKPGHQSETAVLWAHLESLRATHSLPSLDGTGVLWVLTGTHRCDTPIQAG